MTAGKRQCGNKKERNKEGETPGHEGVNLSKGRELLVAGCRLGIYSGLTTNNRQLLLIKCFSKNHDNHSPHPLSPSYDDVILWHVFHRRRKQRTFLRQKTYTRRKLSFIPKLCHLSGIDPQPSKNKVSRIIIPDNNWHICKHSPSLKKTHNPIFYE